MKVIACTPTKNRRWSYAFSAACMNGQIRKPDVWIVLDNSTSPAEDWSLSQQHPLVDYHRVTGVEPIGSLRNKCLELALEQGADYIVFWDDDDYYPPTRISSGVAALEANPTSDIAGSSKMFMLLTVENVLMTVGPYGPTHATAATWTIRKSYADTHRFDPTKTRGEELTFTNNWKANLIQVPPEQSIVVMGHKRNTVDKSDVLRKPQVYLASIVNDANGKQMFRMRWPVQWDLWKSTFSV
jgi:glycosyltransferase involved in cell wall biosynthesis